MTVPLPAGFERRSRLGGGINTLVAGDGPPVLLLHGYPQSHLIWHHVAPELAHDHTVVLTDLRGYGDSWKPDPGDYSKRAMAADQLAVMRELGFDRFAVAGHDRGGRVGHRLALDHPEGGDRTRGAGHRADAGRLREGRRGIRAGVLPLVLPCRRQRYSRAADRR